MIVVRTLRTLIASPKEKNRVIESYLLFAAKQPQGSILVQFVPFVLIFVLFWFLIIRPQRKREQEHQKLLNSLKTGDKVLTNSGIYGEVAEVTQQTVLVEIAPKVRIKMQRQAVSAITAPPAGGSSSSSQISKPESEKAIEESTSSKKKRKRRK
ncbi:MAG: preprotein translocase subunit YajC [Deltaproteobacteria bacterium]|nr:MAG: preprotein translocase subunit YajC [Deltaproteobacteria bacterium]